MFEFNTLQENWFPIVATEEKFRECLIA